MSVDMSKLQQRFSLEPVPESSAKQVESPSKSIRDSDTEQEPVVKTEVLEDLLSNFDNVSLWNSEKTKTVNLGDLNKQNHRKSILSFLPRSASKKHLKDDMDPFSNRSPILRSVSTVHIKQNFSDPIPRSMTLGTHNQKTWGPSSSLSKSDAPQFSRNPLFKKDAEVKKLVERSNTQMHFGKNPSPTSSVIPDSPPPSRKQPPVYYPKREVSIEILSTSEKTTRTRFYSTGCNVPPKPPQLLRQRSLSFPIYNKYKREQIQSRARYNFSKVKTIELTDENLRQIFEYLSFGDLIIASQVCKRWSVILASPGIWQKLYRYYESMLPPATDPNIWEDTHLPTAENDLTLNQLVARLTPNATVPNKSDMETFLATYKTFTTPVKLLRKLVQRYYVPDKEFVSSEEKENYAKTVVRTIQLRVCNIVKCLIQDHFEDFSGEESLRLLCIFIRGLSRTERSFQTLSTVLGKQIAIFSKAKEEVVETNNKTIFSSVQQINILDHKSRVLAEQLTLAEFEYFKAIKPQEFIDQAKSKPKKGDKSAPEIPPSSLSTSTSSSALKSMIAHFNAISRWTEETILHEDRYKIRAKLYEKFIHIAKELKNLNNFETLVAITSALRSTNIERLSFTLAEVNPKDIKILGELHTFMGAENNFKVYRETLKTTSTSCILYLPVLIRDLIYWEDDGASQLAKGHINFKKKKGVFSILEDIQKRQNRGYDNLQVEMPLFDMLKNLPLDTVDMKTLYEMSLKREPRNAKKSDIL